MKTKLLASAAALAVLRLRPQAQDLKFPIGEGAVQLGQLQGI